MPPHQFVNPLHQTSFVVLQDLQQLAQTLPRIQHRVDISQLLHDLLGIVPTSSLRHSSVSFADPDRPETLTTPGSVFGGQANATSPVLTSRHAVMTQMHQGESWLAAFDEVSGEIAWMTARNDKTPTDCDHGYTTPMA